MAATITRQTIIDNDGQLIVKIHIAGDAVGDLSAATLVDASSYDPAFTSASLERVEASLCGFAANLLWDATTDVPLVSLPADAATCFPDDICVRIPNDAGTGKTGDINITTVGLAANDYGTILLHLRKE